MTTDDGFVYNNFVNLAGPARLAQGACVLIQASASLPRATGGTIELVGETAQTSSSSGIQNMFVSREDVLTGDVIRVRVFQSYADRQDFDVVDDRGGIYVELGTPLEDPAPGDDTYLTRFAATATANGHLTVQVRFHPVSPAVSGMAVDLIRNAAKLTPGYAGNVQHAAGTATDALTSTNAVPPAGGNGAWLLDALCFCQTAINQTPEVGTGFVDGGALWDLGTGGGNNLARQEHELVIVDDPAAGTFTAQVVDQDYCTEVLVWAEAPADGVTRFLLFFDSYVVNPGDVPLQSFPMFSGQEISWAPTEQGYHFFTSAVAVLSLEGDNYQPCADLWSAQFTVRTLEASA